MSIQWEIKRFKAALVVIFVLSFLLSEVPVQADNNQSDHGSRYYYLDGQWHEQGKDLVPPVTIGAIIKSLPPEYTTIVIDNTHYYYNNALYFMKLPDDTYVVVPDPH
jgi:hypothetical protein